MHAEKTVLYRTDRRIARISLNRPEVLNAEDMTFLADMTEAIHTDIEYQWDIPENCSKAVICGIHGYCLGGGLQIALACDLRIASDDAVLGLPAVNECLIPGLGTYPLPRLIGLGRARELLLLGDTIDARRALEIGLINEVVPRGELEARCLAVAERFLAVPHTSLSHIKRLSNLAFQTDFAEFMNAFVPAVRACLASPEHQAAKGK